MTLSLSVIPADMRWRPTPQAAQRALAVFKELFRGAETHEARTFAGVHFINPELFASKAFCPTCAKASERYREPDDAQRQWFAEIDRNTLDAPVDLLRTVMPACGHEAPFTALTFEWEAGFASFALIAPYAYWDDDLMNEYQPLDEQRQALGAALGTPVKVVRTYHALRPADRRSFEGLMSTDEATRVAGAQALDALEQGHFEDHPMAASYAEENAPRLLAAFHATGSRDARAWILTALADVKDHPPAVVAAVAPLLVPAGDLLETALYMIHRCPKPYAHLTPELIALKDHPDRNVRWRVAMGLAHSPLAEAPGVLDALRAMMLDTDAGTRLQAVLALHHRRKLRTLEPADRAVLQQVIAMDEKSAAARHAQQLLESQGEAR